MYSNKRIMPPKKSYNVVDLKDDECFEYRSEARFFIYFFKSLFLSFFGSLFSIAGFFVKNQMAKGRVACTISGRSVPCEEMSWFPWIFIIIGLLIVLGSVFGEFCKYLEAKKLIYYVYNDHIEYEDGFFNREKKSISKDTINAIYLKQGFLQRLYGVGTVMLSMDNIAI